MVRLEAVRALRARGGDEACVVATRIARDGDLAVALEAIDHLGGCDESTDALDVLDALAHDSARDDPHGWQRRAHAALALATAAPDRARPIVAELQSAAAPEARGYAARAAAVLRDRDALERLAADSNDRVANAALAALGAPLRSTPDAPPATSAPLSATDLRRLAAPRARFTIRGLGRIDVALFTAEAPATVLRFVELAEAGYYNGRSFERVMANSIAQTGRGGAAAPVSTLRDEVGLWPHVRGALGMATHGRDTGDGEIFFDLVDNPSFDHELTVFAQVLNGMDILEQLAEGDVIESIEILP